MKFSNHILPACLILFSLVNTAYAVCDPFSNWTTSWTDGYNQTRYSVSAPCKVYIGVPFNITAKVTDTAWANTYVAYPWGIQDTYSTSTKKYSSQIANIGSGWLMTDANKQWQTVISRTYTGTPYDHKIEFVFIDNGNGDEPFAHHISKHIAGGLTVDPYQIILAQGYTLSESQQNNTVISAKVFNPNGATLTCRWLEGASVLQSKTLNSTGYLDVPINLSEIPPLSVGTHTLTLEVSDGTATENANVLISITSSSNGNPGGTPVPIMDAWWLLPGVLTGIGMIVRKRKE